MANVNFNELITFTRATGGGRFNASGQYEWLPANEPRFDYDPVTKAVKGLLIEEQRTNLLTYSEQFDNGSWLMTRASVSPNHALAPDGTLTADKLIEGAVTGGKYVYKGGSVTEGVAHTLSVYAKAGERNYIEVSAFNTPSALPRFDLTTGAVTVANANAIATSATPCKDGWWRLSVTVIPTVTGNMFFGFTVVDTATGTSGYTGDGTSGIYIWGAQLEAGAFPTSYIPTTTAQVTRAADVASVNELSPWYRQDEGTLAVDYLLGADNSNCGVANIAEGATSTDRMMMRYSSGAIAQAEITTGGVSQANLAPSGYNTPGAYKRAISYSADWFQQAINGALPSAADTSVVVPTAVNTLKIGHEVGASSFLNGHIKSIKYLPRALSNTELQEITT
jgi:hypothetical protein